MKNNLEKGAVWKTKHTFEEVNVAFRPWVTFTSSEADAIRIAGDSLLLEATG